MTYAKLFSSIVHSTVWREELHVKVVWITMIALANRHGEVQASIPGLADAAKVTLLQCEDALSRLSSPDKYSRTKEYDGRRIAEMDGGWLILNYARHRATIDKEEEREKTRLRVAKHRAKKAEVTEAANSNAPSRKETIPAKPAPAPLASPEASTTPKAAPEATPTDNGLPSAPPSGGKDNGARKTKGIQKAKPRGGWVGRAMGLWTEVTGGSVAGGRMGRALGPVVAEVRQRQGCGSDDEAWALVAPELEQYLRVTEPRFVTPEGFARAPRQGKPQTLEDARAASYREAAEESLRKDELLRAEMEQEKRQAFQGESP
jgi:hypothetical protein